VGRWRIGPKKVSENSKGFSISCFDSNSNSIRISNEFYTNLKLKHSIKSKQNASGMKMQQTIIYFLN
jgi:gamma-glutamylcysteine synthetase